MKTDQLINILSTNLEPFKAGQMRKALAIAVVVGGVGAFCVMLGTVGFPPNGLIHPGSLASRLLLTLGLVAVGSTLLARLVRPDGGGRKLLTLTALLLLVIATAGTVALGFEGSAGMDRISFGVNRVTHLFWIPLFAVAPFTCLIWFAREGAPTDLTSTGAVVGLVAGALGASAYVFHSIDDPISCIAVSYGAMVALCSLAGAFLGPRLLRW